MNPEKKSSAKPALQQLNQRVGVFIDVSNLYHSAKNIYHGRVNYQELLKHVVKGRPVVRALAYVVRSDASVGESSFFDALEKTGLELRSKDLQVYGDGLKKGDWDIGMAVDAIRMSDLVDVVVLVTGDGDFMPLVEYLKWGRGKIVEVAAFQRSASSKLQEGADKFLALESIPKIILRK